MMHSCSPSVDKPGGSLSYITMDNDPSQVRWVSGGEISNGKLRSFRSLRNIYDFMERNLCERRRWKENMQSSAPWPQSFDQA